MFTGIIEETGIVAALKRENTSSAKETGNLNISIRASFLKEIKVDQSIAHNGVCLTVVDKRKDYYTVTAISETLSRTNLGFLKIGDKVNLERCMKADGRFDGHIVQGHVDCTAKVDSIKEQNGSWVFKFKIMSREGAWNLIVEKGSVCVNGVSLTVVNCGKNSFSVAIIPYTFHHTNFHALKTGDIVNVEFDIIGKYIEKILSSRQ